MAIQLGKKTKLTTDVEKALVELGGADPNKTLSEDELGDALVNAIDTIGDQNPSLLERIYERGVKAGHYPPIDSQDPLP